MTLTIVDQLVSVVCQVQVARANRGTMSAHRETQRAFVPRNLHSLPNTPFHRDVACRCLEQLAVAIGSQSSR
jgi:hypothetical protein